MPDADFRRLSFPALVLALVLASLALAGPSTAASKSCGDQVIADWYGDGRVDKVFPLQCYQAAIRSLPVDVLDYSNAKEDILRALAFARKGKKDPGPSGGSQTKGNTDTTGDPSGSGGPGGPSHPGPEGSGNEASGAVDTSGPSSVPIPLLILGLGNVLLEDDGVGGSAVSLLLDRFEPHAGVHVFDGGTLGL